MTDELTRIAQAPRPNRILLAGVAASAALTTAVIAQIAMTTAPVAPAPQAAAPQLLPIAAPQLLVLPTPAPEPTPAPAPAPPAPRATTPFVRASCVLPGDEVPDACSWDDGFPAISADGKTIAIERYAEDGGRGNPGLSIELVDAATSRMKRAMLVLDPDEVVDPIDDKAPALHATIARRAEAAQRVLDAGGFRALARIGSSTGDSPGEAGLRAQFEEGRVRVIDLASNAIVWQREFSIEKQFPNRVIDPDTDGCQPSHTGEIAIAWDAPTRTVLAEVTYPAGPCYCPSTIVDYVHRLPTR